MIPDTQVTSSLKSTNFSPKHVLTRVSSLNLAAHPFLCLFCALCFPVNLPGPLPQLYKTIHIPSSSQRSLCQQPSHTMMEWPTGKSPGHLSATFINGLHVQSRAQHLRFTLSPVDSKSAPSKPGSCPIPM